ncbi:hypothetical protein CSUI_002313, partial [Cystoisospora suis]
KARKNSRGRASQFLLPQAMAMSAGRHMKLQDVPERHLLSARTAS